jgi:hypothetical protein
MEPVVNRLLKDYRSCLQFEHVNYHSQSKWQGLVFPVGSPEFALVEASGKVRYRWFGVTEREEFDQVLKPLCN